MAVARSGWYGSVPESSMPTRMPWPVTFWPSTVMSQASSACVSCSASDSSGAASVAALAAAAFLAAAEISSVPRPERPGVWTRRSLTTRRTFGSARSAVIVACETVAEKAGMMW